MTNCSILQAHWTQLITPCGIGHMQQSRVHFLEDKSLRFRKLICRPTFILCMNKKYTAIYRLGYGLHILIVPMQYLDRLSLFTFHRTVVLRLVFYGIVS